MNLKKCKKKLVTSLRQQSSGESPALTFNRSLVEGNGTGVIFMRRVVTWKDELVLTVLLMCWGMVSYGGWF